MRAYDTALLIIYTVYGASFLVMSAAIWSHVGKTAKLGIASRLQLLAVFGVLHGVGDLTDVALRLPAPALAGIHSALEVVRLLLLTLSFLVLLQFGLAMVIPNEGQYRRVLRYGGLGAGALVVALLAVYLEGPDEETIFAAERVSRLVIGLPGGLLATYGFARIARGCARLGAYGCGSGAMVATVGMGFYAVLAGAIATVHPTTFEILGLPIQLYRMIAAIVLTIGCIEMLRRMELPSPPREPNLLRRMLFH